MEKFIIANNCATQISDSEQGEKCIVLLHGYLESLNIFERLAFLLKSNLRVVTIDLPGHGVSEVKSDIHTMEFLADVVADTLRVLHIEKAIILGHSLGGYVALAFAERHIDMLSGLILLSSTPYADSPERKLDRDREIKLIQSGKKDTIATLFPSQGFAPQNVKKYDWAVDEIAEQIYLTEDDGAIAILRGMRDRADRSKLLASLSVPKLLIFGRNDAYLDNETANKMIAENPSAKVKWLENSGHMGFIEEEQTTADTIIDFANNI